MLSLLTKFGDNETAKPLILRTLESGDKAERDEILRVIGASGGISGDDVYDKISDLARRGIVQAEARTTLLVRINKTRARPELLRDLTSNVNNKVFVRSAAALQNYYGDPSDYAKIIPGILQRGLHKEGSYDKGNGLFWINADHFAQYVQSASGDNLKPALEVLEADSVLCKPTLTSMLIQHLESPRPEVRVLAARALMKTLAQSGADQGTIKTALHQALGREQSAAVKLVLKKLVRRINLREALPKK